jgi:hypothetical protein
MEYERIQHTRFHESQKNEDLGTKLKLGHPDTS